MKFWTTARILGWLCYLSMPTLIIARIYQHIKHVKTADTARFMDTKPGCAANCGQQVTVDIWPDVITPTFFWSLVVIAPFVLCYLYLWHALRAIDAAKLAET